MNIISSDIIGFTGVSFVIISSVPNTINLFEIQDDFINNFNNVSFIGNIIGGTLLSVYAFMENITPLYAFIGFAMVNLIGLSIKIILYYRQLQQNRLY
jgi:hypothetical protein